MSATPNTVLLKGGTGHIIRKEGLANAAITPGMLVERNGSGYRKHASAGQNARKLFALEQENIGNGIDTDIASGDQFGIAACQSEVEIYALLPASATAVALNDPLTSNGDGTLKKFVPQAVAEGGAANYTIYTEAIVAYALEAVDNSGGGSVARIRVAVA